MSTPPPKTDAAQVSGVLHRVNHLGQATEQLFSRLYNTLNRRTRLRAEIERAQALEQRNRQLAQAVRRRDAEIERLSAILSTIDEGIIMQDTEGRLVLVNAAARRLLGSQKAFWESDLGRLFEAYRHITELDTELAPVGEPIRVQVNNRIIGAQLAVVADPTGKRLGTMIVLRDVTRTALSDRLKEQFITAISHELRTPMAAIKGMSEVLANQPAGKPINRRFLETISRNVDILDRMIVELLDISEMSADAFSVHQRLLNVNELLSHVAQGMLPEVLRAQLEVTLMVRDAASLYVLGDDQRLRWALGHLLQNSIRYTEPGGHILLTARLENANRVAIQVVDTGVGISEKDLPHIFERFYRGEPRTSSGKLLDRRGLGQGLFIARKVAEAHQGYLSVRSAPGQGSVFTMTLPAAPAPRPN